MSILPRLPLRFKILFTILLLTTFGFCAITFVMARTFHKDKALYINDLASELANHASEKVETIVSGYRDRLLLFTRLVFDQNSPGGDKNALVRKVFEDFREFVAIRIIDKGTPPVYIYDLKSLEEAGITREDIVGDETLEQFPFQPRNSDLVFVENSTLSPRLPTVSVSIFRDHPEGGRLVMLTAIVRLDKLIDISSHSSSFDTFVLDSRGRILVHKDMEKISGRAPADWLPDLSSLRDRKFGTVANYTYQGRKMIGGFAHTELGDMVTGVQIPEATAFLTATELLNNLIYATFGLLTITALVSVSLARYITRPLARLTEVTREISTGNFDIAVERSSNDEIGELTDSFNTMARELGSRERALMEARELATRDGLTGLFNHRYFKEAMAKEIARSERHGHSFSLIMLDLDNFKNYNDTNGHLAGDALLSQLGRIIMKNIRGTDFPARYGGEEFVVILPETNKNNAFFLAEKIRKEIASYPFENREAQPLGLVSASFGISTFPDDGRNRESLFKHADDLLYQAKRKGKNVVCL